jgi:hypothetical protein
MNAAQKRAVEALKAEIREAAVQLGQQNNGPVTHQSDQALALRLAHKAGMGFYLGEQFVVDTSGITTEWLIQRVVEKTAERLGLTVEQLEALPAGERRALILGDRELMVRREFRYSDRGER